MKTSDIPDEAFLAAVQAIHDAEYRWAMTWEIAEALNVPVKLVLSKARRLIRRGVMDGCPCGCRGDFEIPGWRDTTPKPEGHDPVADIRAAFAVFAALSAATAGLPRTVRLRPGIDR